MRYIKETRPGSREEITKAEAEAGIGTDKLREVEEQVGRYERDFPGIAVMVETGAGIYVGAQAKGG